MFGDSDVQNGAIWVQPSGLHMHHASGVYLLEIPFSDESETKYSPCVLWI